MLFALVLLVPATVFAQAAANKNVLILNEVGLSHALTNVTTQQIVTDVQERPERHVEFYSESLDLLSFPEKPTLPEIRDWLAKKYNGHNLDVVVAVGPDTINFLAKYTQSMFLNVPIVICGSAEDHAGYPRLDSRFTGTWQKREPEKTIEAALRLFPETKHVYVVAGSSSYDHFVLTATKRAFRPFPANLTLTYLEELEMSELLQQLRHLPEHSIVLYLSIFQDAAGNKFLNATQALPWVTKAANAPVFGMSDTYLGHGVVGGDLMNFHRQAERSADIISQLLDGRQVQEIPIETLPSEYMFDWHELRRWQVPDSRLPFGSVVLFREPSLWERTWWIWTLSSAIILALSVLVVYLLYNRKQLKIARERQLQLSGMLISAEEKERSRLASELHDDFSQRLAVMALKLENVAEIVSPVSEEADRQLHELLNSTSELGADLHTLSHHLHSSTLESLGLVPALTALCKEFTFQQNIEVQFSVDGVPRHIEPDAALCIFRVVQEALRNLKKYSSAREARVALHESHSKLEVSVRDEGRGFDISDLPSKEGLGIRSMRERVRLLGGEFRVDSAPGRGTTVIARLPADAHEAIEKPQE